MHVPIYIQGSTTIKCLCGWTGNVNLPLVEAAYLAVHAGHRQAQKDYSLSLNLQQEYTDGGPCAICLSIDQCVELDAGFDATWLVCQTCCKKAGLDTSHIH